MKPSDERYTAWVDGQLSAEEAAAFESELGDGLPEAEADRAAARALGRLLREKGKAPAMPHADFFRSQLLETIRREEMARQPREAVPVEKVPLWRLFWATAACSLVGGILAISLNGQGGDGAFTYQARILEARPGSPGISAVPIHSSKANATVLWLDGLDYLTSLPSEGRQ